jgi:hypothetical protein
MTDVYAPLYEAKMLSFYDSRFQTYEGAESQSLPGLTDAQHDDPNKEPLPRYWIAEEHVDEALDGKWDREWLLGWRDIARSTDYRTFITSTFPVGGAGDTLLLSPSSSPKDVPLLAGIWASLMFDFVTRNNISGTHLKFHLVKQLACPTPAQLGVASPWLPTASISDEIRDRVRELTVTSWRMVPFARDMGDFGPPFRWLPARREQIRAELDAMMFHVYGLDRDEVDYVLDTFTVMRKYDERDHGEYRTKRLILEYYDLLASSISSGVGYVTPISPMPGDGPRHDESTRPEWMPGVE